MIKTYFIFICITCFSFLSCKKDPDNNTGGPYEATIFIGSNDHKIYSVDLLSGTKNWEFATGMGIFSSPVLYNGTLYCGSGDGKFYAIDGELFYDPVIKDDVLYISSGDKRLYAIDIATGTKKWEYTGTDNLSSPVPGNKNLYAGSWNNNLYSFDLKTGKGSVRFHASGAIYTAPCILLSDGTVINSN